MADVCTRILWFGDGWEDDRSENVVVVVVGGGSGESDSKSRMLYTRINYNH